MNERAPSLPEQEAATLTLKGMQGEEPLTWLV